MEDICGILNVLGRNYTVSEIIYALILGMYDLRQM